jgi:hypothetical protein
MSCGEGAAGTSDAEEQQLHLEVEAAMTEIPGSRVDGNARTQESYSGMREPAGRCDSRRERGENSGGTRGEGELGLAKGGAGDFIGKRVAWEPSHRCLDHVAPL